MRSSGVKNGGGTASGISLASRICEVVRICLAIISSATAAAVDVQLPSLQLFESYSLLNSIMSQSQPLAAYVCQSVPQVRETGNNLAALPVKCTALK